MERQEAYRQAFISSLQRITFAERYKVLSEKFNEPDLDKLEQKTDKKQILEFLKSLGYECKYYMGGDFDYRESVGDFNFQLLFIVKRGIIINYLRVSYEEEHINDEYHLGFIYRSLLNNMSAEISAPVFKNYSEFQEIAKEILSIYEDFKREFLKEISE